MMKNSKQLENDFNQVEKDAKETLRHLISQNLGKEIDPEHDYYFTYTKSFSGRDDDFHLEGIEEDGTLVCIDAENCQRIEGLRVDEIHLWAIIKMVELLEERSNS